MSPRQFSFSQHFPFRTSTRQHDNNIKKPPHRWYVSHHNNHIDEHTLQNICSPDQHPTTKELVTCTYLLSALFSRFTYSNLILCCLQVDSISTICTEEQLDFLHISPWPRNPNPHPQLKRNTTLPFTGSEMAYVSTTTHASSTHAPNHPPSYHST